MLRLLLLLLSYHCPVGRLCIRRTARATVRAHMLLMTLISGIITTVLIHLQVVVRLRHGEARHLLETICTLNEACTLLDHLSSRRGRMLQQRAALVVILGLLLDDHRVAGALLVQQA